MDGVAPRGVGATRVVLVGAFVCSVAPCRRVYTIDPGALVRHSPAVPPTPVVEKRGVLAQPGTALFFTSPATPQG